MGEGWNSMGSPNEAATQPGPGSGPPDGGPATHHDEDAATVDPPPPPPLAVTTSANNNEDPARSSNSSPSSTTGSTGSTSSDHSSTSSENHSSATAASKRANGKHGGRRWKAEHQPLRKTSSSSLVAHEEGNEKRIIAEAASLPEPEVVVTPSRLNQTSEESDEDDGMDVDRKSTPSRPASPLVDPSPKQSEQQQDHYCLRWTNHGSHVLGVFAQLLRDESLVDVTLAAEGRSLRAHKMVLSACSSFFRTLFVSHSEQRHPIVILKDTKFTELESLLQFMYKGEVSVEYGQLATLLKTAENLRVKGLADVTTTAAAAAAASQPKKADVLDEEEEDEEDEEEDEDDEDMFDEEMEDTPIVIERSALASGLSSLTDSVGRMQRRQRRRHHLHNLSNPYRRSLLPSHPNHQVKASGRSGLDAESLANHHRLVQEGGGGGGAIHYQHHIKRRGIVNDDDDDDSIVPLDLIHPEVIQDLSSNAASVDRRAHNSRRNNNNPQANHVLPDDWKPPDELQHPPRRQLKPSLKSNHQQQQHNHHHKTQHRNNANDPASAANVSASASGNTEKLGCVIRDPDDGDHNHRFKSAGSSRNDPPEQHTHDAGLDGQESPLDSMAQDCGTAQDLRRMPPHSPLQSLSPSSSPLLPSGPPTSGATAATSGGASTGHPHQRFRHWMMEEESDESGEEVEAEDEDMEEKMFMENRRQGTSRSHNTSASNAHHHPPSNLSIGSPQHLPMVPYLIILFF